MDFDNIENLNEEQILNLYSDIIENNDSSFLIADAGTTCCINRFQSPSTPNVSGACYAKGSAWCYGPTTLGYVYCPGCK